MPLLGYLDDLLDVPFGIMLAVRLIPQALMADFRAIAVQREGRPVSRAGLVIIVTFWLIAIAGAAVLVWPRLVGAEILDYAMS